jgi:carbonic anhydrase/acetyltransferase-like protein (isoleucine patch superfamily)
MILPNPWKQEPKISDKAWIAETAIIVGNVIIGDNVFISHNAIIRADEPGSSIVIENNCNIQDNVIIHGISNSKVIVHENTSLAHRCTVHGPCTIGKGCFIGFGAVVFDCTIGNNSVVLHNATVRKVDIPDGKVVADGKAVTTQEDADSLENITNDLISFKNTVIMANLELVKGYKNL